MSWFTIHTLHCILLVQMKVRCMGHVGHTANKYTKVLVGKTEKFTNGPGH
jgi:hypothetical protein